MMKRNGWQDDYDILLKGKPKNTWIPWIHGSIGDKGEVEISIVHTSAPHGLLSYGWDGPRKVVLFSGDSRSIPRQQRKLLHQRMIAISEVMAEEFQKKFPKGVDNP